MAAASTHMSRPNLSLAGSLDQPPPAYENTSSNGEHRSQPRQEYVHMTTTQSVTVTTQMIVPLRTSTTMAKRDPQLDCPVQTDAQRPPRGTLLLNKDLPPPPTDDPDVHPNRQFQSKSLPPPVPLPVTFALAHAALGLGLPSALPQPPRVSISGPPTSPTIQVANDVGSGKGPLARLRVGGTSNATIETPRQRKRFISLGVRPTTAPVNVSDESRLTVQEVHEPIPRTSNSTFGKKVRRAKSFTDKLRSAVGSPESNAGGHDAYKSEGEEDASRKTKRASWWTKRRADSKSSSSPFAPAHTPTPPLPIPNPMVLPSPASAFPPPSALPVRRAASTVLKKKRFTNPTLTLGSQKSPSSTNLETDASAPQTPTPIVSGFVDLSHSPPDRETNALSLPRLPSTSIAQFSPLFGVGGPMTGSPAGTPPSRTPSSLTFPSDTPATSPPVSPMPISQSQPMLSHLSPKSPVSAIRSKSLDPSKAPPGPGRPRSSSLFIKNAPSPPDDSPMLVVSGPSPARARAEPQAIPRPRTAPQPPLLRRLSSALLFSSSPQGPSAFGMSPSSPSGTPPPPAVHGPPPSPVRTRPPRPAGESPSTYVTRLLSAVTNAEVASVLASSADEFHTTALNEYMRRFTFVDDPLDVALRELLMDVGLPRETQQIDRVMESFARRYNECNDGIWGQEDHAYVLAFSLMMLHTDAFNKNNRNKMTKADYVKNTRLPGVLPEMLEYFYDNVTFAPFIFIEDPMDINGQRGLDSSLTPTSSILSKSNKVDPYFLITQGRLGQLRIEVDKTIPKETPYSSNGAPEPWDEEELRKAFANAMVVRSGVEEYDHTCSPRRHASAPSFAGHGAFGGIPPPGIHLASPTTTGEQRYKLTKVGILNRKDDLADGGTRASRGRKWRTWSVVLTGSSLLFFRNLDWYREIEEGGLLEEGGHALHGALQGADETISLNDAIAVIDATYTKYPTTFRLALGTGKQLLIGASDDEDRNDWMARINYASAFRTAGVRMRHAMPEEDAELLGVMAARSHLQQILPPQLPPTPVYSWGSPLPENSNHSIYANSPTDDSFHGSRLTFNYATGDIGIVSPSSSTEDLREQAKNAMEVAKAELASSVECASPITRSRAVSVGASSVMEGSVNDTAPSPPEAPSLHRSSGRSDVLTTKIKDLESKITTTRLQLDADLRATRSLAILTPFQQATRNRLQEGIRPLAKRIKLCRLDLAKLECHRDILRDDLAAGEQDWESTKGVIAKAARRAYASNPRRNLIPRVRQIATPPEDRPRRASDAALTDREPSRAELVQQGLSHSTSLGSLQPMQEGVELKVEEVSNPQLSPSRSLRGKRPRLSEDSSDGVSASVQHERFVIALESPREEAEEWNKTKAAKRVSLVRMPMDALRVFASSHPEAAVNPAALKEEAVSPRNSIASDAVISDAVMTPRPLTSG